LQLGLRWRWCGCQTYWAAGESFNRHFRPYALERSRTHIQRCLRLGLPSDSSLPATTAPSLPSPLVSAEPRPRNLTIPSGHVSVPPPPPLAVLPKPPPALRVPCFCVFCAACACRGGACHCSCPRSCTTCHSSPPDRSPPLRPRPSPSPAASFRAPSSSHNDNAIPHAVSARVWRELPLQFWPAWRAAVGPVFSRYLTSLPHQRSDLIPLLLWCPPPSTRWGEAPLPQRAVRASLQCPCAPPPPKRWHSWPSPLPV
jgi:hypothetical protein